MADLNFENNFKHLIVSMKLNCCYPGMELNKYWVLRIALILIQYTLYFCLLSNSLRYYLEIEDYFNAFRISVSIAIYICMMFNFCLFTAHRDVLGNLIKSMKNDYVKAWQFDYRGQAVIIDYSTKGMKITKAWAITLSFIVIIFLIKSISLTLILTIQNGHQTLMPYFEMHYPYGINEYRENNVYVYTTSFLGELSFSLISFLMYFSTVPLGPIFMLHVCGQLELIEIKFENIFEDDNVDDNLGEIVQNLQYIYSFVDNNNICFTFIYEVMLKQTMIMLPFTAYAMVQSVNNGKLAVEYVGVFIQTVLMSSLPCYYADLLMQKGENVRMAAYNCGWERVHTPLARKTLLIILTRALKPIAVKSIFGPICLDTLTNTYRQAYTIFNLMSAMW